MIAIDRRFGERDPVRDYLDRPGSYALAIRGGEVLCVEEGAGLFLPEKDRGGHEGDETPVEALHREMLEETGWTIEIDGKFGVAEEFFPLRNGRGLRKVCHLYRVTLQQRRRPPEATDCPISWLAPSVAEQRLYQEAFQWMVAES
ncbi:MAG: NUDIX domain-containing protein [Bradymonadaceae bacterium]